MKEMDRAVRTAGRPGDSNPTEIARDLSSTVLAVHASRVDRSAHFPAESIAALRESGLLASSVRPEYGGLGASLETLARIGVELGRGCGSSAMIWAMHQVQIACVARHHGGEDELARRLSSLVSDGKLIASATSEVGIGGNLRNSATAIEYRGSTAVLDKRAPTISYGEYADAYLVTARRAPNAQPGDQVAVLASADESTLTPFGPPWDSMGMRGTCSSAFQLTATVPATRVLPVRFETIAAATMVPLSHILWAAVWIGIAGDAFSRAQRCVRGRTATATDHLDPRLALAGRILRQLQALLAESVSRYSPLWDEPDRIAQHGGLDLTMALNDLKVLTSTLTVDLVTCAMEICGMAGYAEHGPLSVSRHLRDLFSARLMIGNDRLNTTNARLSLMMRV